GLCLFGKRVHSNKSSLSVSSGGLPVAAEGNMLGAILALILVSGCACITHHGEEIPVFRIS
ncbi:hypothetical protein KIPB_017326, partial [Kipferlia bialata]